MTKSKLKTANNYCEVKRFKDGDVISMKIEQMTRMGKCVGSVAVKINNAMYCFGTDKLRIAASKAITMYLKEYRIKPSKHKTTGCNTPTGARHCVFEGVAEGEK